MSEVTGNVVLELKADKFEHGKSRVISAFGEIERAGTSSFQKISVPLGQAEGKIVGLGQKTEFSAKRSVAALTGLVTSVGSTVIAYRNLDDVQLRLRKTELLAQVQKQKLIDLEKEGMKGTEEYRIAQERLAITQEKVRQTTEDVQNSQLQFGLTMTTLAVSTIPAGVGAIANLIRSHGVAAGAAGVHAVANTALTGSMWRLNVSMLANPLFAIPTAIAIAGATAFVATNQFGLRDAIFGTTEALDVNTKSLLASSSTHQRLYTPTVNKTKSSLVEVRNSIDDVTESVTKQGDAFSSTENLMKAYLDGIQKQSKELETVNDKLRIHADILERTFGKLSKFQQLRILETIGEIESRTFKKKDDVKGSGKKAANNTEAEFTEFDKALMRQIDAEYENILQRIRFNEITFGQKGKELVEKIKRESGIGPFNLSQATINAMIAGRQAVGMTSFNVLGDLAQVAHTMAVGKVVGTRIVSPLETRKGQSIKSVGGFKVSNMTQRSNFSRKQRGGHSKYRMDRANGRWNAFLAFKLPKIIARTGLDSETGQRLAEMAITGQGSSADRSRRHIPFSFNQERFNQLVAEELARRRAEEERMRARIQEINTRASFFSSKLGENITPSESLFDDRILMLMNDRIAFLGFDRYSAMGTTA